MTGVGAPRAALARSARDLLDWISIRYRSKRSSIFLDGLVGGMFLDFLMTTDDNCHDLLFPNIFFIIGILHYLSYIVGGLADYGRRAAAADGEESGMERRIALLCILVQHLVKLAQFPLVAGLGWYVLQFSTEVAGRWTVAREEVVPKGAGAADCSTCYCNRNSVNLATLVFGFQVLSGLITLASWFVMWWVDREDDAMEQLEDREYQEMTRRQANTILGKIKAVTLVIGKQSFFNSNIAGKLLSISVALPHESCNIHVTEWFLFIGVTYTLTEVLTRLTAEVEAMAMQDGIINRAEHILIDTLHFLKLPLFLFEVVAFGVVMSRTMAHINTVDFESSGAENFCEQGIWKLMLAISGIYTVVLVFRVTVVLASLVGKEEGEGGEVEDLPGAASEL